MFYGIKAIGDLSTGLASVLPERYRSESLPDGVTRKLYTRPDGRYDLCTLIDAPNPCDNEFTALFGNWIAKKVKQHTDRASGAAQPASSTPQSKE
jgi:hypothetical protein